MDSRKDEMNKRLTNKSESHLLFLTDSKKYRHQFYDSYLNSKL